MKGPEVKAKLVRVSIPIKNVFTVHLLRQELRKHPGYWEVKLTEKYIILSNPFTEFEEKKR